MRKILKIVPLFISALVLSSCRFDEIFNKVKTIIIEDFRNGYQTTHVFDEKNELNIIAGFTNGTFKNLKYSEVKANISTGENPSQAFTSPGTKDVSVTYKNITSNSISIDVSDEIIGLSSISLEASSSEIEFRNSIDVTFTVSPSNYNVDLVPSASSDSLFFEKTGKNQFTLTCVNVEGEEEEYASFSLGDGVLSDSKNFTLRYVCKKVEMKQTYETLLDHSSLASCPLTGDVKFLVLPLWFTDSSSYIVTSNKENVRSDIEKAYFGSNTGWESVSTYYSKESQNKLNISGTVSEWLSIDHSIMDFAEDDNYATKTSTLICGVTDYYFETHPEDNRKNYDANGDGYIDAVICIYGAADHQVSKNPNASNLWAYRAFTDYGKDVDEPNVKSYFWASYDFMYNESTALKRTGKIYGNGDTTNGVTVDTHTFIHETGHILGLEDYYDYSEQYSPCAGFSMQDFNVGGHDPFSVMAYGWASPFIPEISCKLKIYSFQETHELILLTNSWNSYDSPFDEYLLLELYTPEGLNERDTKYRYNSAYPNVNRYPIGVDSVGIRLWHVDARLTYLIGGINNYSTELTSNAAYKETMKTAFANSFIKGSATTSSHLSPLVKPTSPTTYKYAEYNLLQLLRNNTRASYQGGKSDVFTESHLFKKGSSFSMNKYASQFYNSGKLNSGSSLSWGFSVDEIGKDEVGYYAVINLTK